MSKHIKLGMFYWPCGHHIAAWRHPDAVADSGANIAHLIALAQLAERGLFDMFFMADTVTFWRGTLASMARDSYCAWIEPGARVAQSTVYPSQLQTRVATEILLWSRFGCGRHVRRGGKRSGACLWNDPATGVMRHADAGYDLALDCARRNALWLPSQGGRIQTH